MDSDQTAGSATNPSSWIWILTLAVATLPVVVGLCRVWIFFDEEFPHQYWSRTLPALAAVALVLAGIVAPLWVVIKRRAFRRRPSLGQWRVFGVVLLLMSLAYVWTLIALADAARKARAILPYTPSVMLLHSKDAEQPFRFEVLGGPPGTGHGSVDRGRDDVIVTWSEWLEPGELSRPQGPDPVVRLRCEATLYREPMLIKVEVQPGRRVHFDIRGFVNPIVEQNGKSVALPMGLNAGTHRFTIRCENPA